MKTFSSILLFLALSACGAQPAAQTTQKAESHPAAPNTVLIDNFTFNPPTIAVPVNCTVTWINHDDIPHTVTGAAGPTGFASKTLDTDQQYQFTFKEPGTYTYFCSLHPHMTATVIVK